MEVTCLSLCITSQAEWQLHDLLFEGCLQVSVLGVTVFPFLCAVLQCVTVQPALQVREIMSHSWGSRDSTCIIRIFPVWVLCLFSPFIYSVSF